MDFIDITMQLFLADDRDPEEIREAVLAYQQRMDLAREAGRLVELAADSDKKRKGTRDLSCLPGYSKTADGIRRGDVTTISCSREYV